MYCSKCGINNKDEANFCSGCGHELNKTYKQSATLIEEIDFGVVALGSAIGWLYVLLAKIIMFLVTMVLGFILAAILGTQLYISLLQGFGGVILQLIGIVVFLCAIIIAGAFVAKRCYTKTGMHCVLAGIGLIAINIILYFLSDSLFSSSQFLNKMSLITGIDAESLGWMDFLYFIGIIPAYYIGGVSNDA